MNCGRDPVGAFEALVGQPPAEFEKALHGWLRLPPDGSLLEPGESRMAGSGGHPMRTAERRSKPEWQSPMTNGKAQFRLAGRVNFPAWITDHESFRRRARLPECPEKLRVAFYDGGIWVDADMEQFFAHNQVKAEVSIALATLAQAQSSAASWSRGCSLSNPEAGFSTIPDGYFVSYDAFRTGRVRQVPVTRRLRRAGRHARDDPGGRQRLVGP